MWYRKNKAAQKWTETEVEQVFIETAEWLDQQLKDKPDDVILFTDINIYMLKVHGVSHQLRSVWLNKIHKSNISICNLWSYIENVLEGNVAKTDKLRPNIQALILQNKHNYREKRETDTNVNINQMPSIKVGDKELKFDIGEDKQKDD